MTCKNCFQQLHTMKNGCPECGDKWRNYTVIDEMSELKTKFVVKEQAIRYIKDVQNGKMDKTINGVPVGKIVDGLNLWYDTNFSYGMEYGAILALMQLFDIEKDDL